MKFHIKTKQGKYAADSKYSIDFNSCASINECSIMRDSLYVPFRSWTGQVT